jgi:hypothetical protein
MKNNVSSTQIVADAAAKTRHPEIGTWKNIPMNRDRLRSGVDELVNIARENTNSDVVEKMRELALSISGTIMIVKSA